MTRRAYTPPPDPFAPTEPEDPDDVFADWAEMGDSLREDTRRYYERQAEEARRRKETT